MPDKRKASFDKDEESARPPTQRKLSQAPQSLESQPYRPSLQSIETQAQFRKSASSQSTKAYQKFLELHPVRPRDPDFADGADIHESYKILEASRENHALPPLPPLAAGPHSDAVFIHASTVHTKTLASSPTKPDVDYNHLEFYGDAILEYMAVELIYERFSHLDVGKQNRLREELTKNRTLARFAQGYGFRKVMRVERTMHEVAGDGAWTKALADVFEAYIAGVVRSHKDGGLSRVREWLMQLWAPMILDIRSGNSDVDLEGNDVNFKDVLQAQIGAPKGVKIEYRQTAPMSYTKDRALQQFTIGCFVTGWGFQEARVGVGQGQSKREAGVKAAELALKKSSEVKTMKERKASEDAERKRRAKKEKQKLQEGY
ncbi:MAG: hypothetical protein Q9159_007003 [Coniocarpon cinnabarinum]